MWITQFLIKYSLSIFLLFVNAIYSVAVLAKILHSICYTVSMYYAQLDYKIQRQGIPPTKYTIAQIGCFLTAFCNLLSDYGYSVSPLKLNSFFRDKRVYIDSDDGVKDDLYWGAVSKYAPELVVTDTGVGGLPPHNRSIVKLSSRNTFGTHFCKVYSIKNGHLSIVDSWDGKIKSSDGYGKVLAWATYKDMSTKKKSYNGKTYKVKSSDSDGLIATLSRIGYGKQWRHIAHINNMHTPYIIRPGQIIKLM